MWIWMELGVYIVPVYIGVSEGDGSKSRYGWKWEYIVPV